MKLLFLSLLLLLLLPLQALAICECSANQEGRDTTKALRLKLVAFASILTAGALGILIPILGRSVALLRPEHDVFFIIKAFAAGVILATGMIHILPDAFERLTSPCLAGDPRRRFPFAGFIAMLSAMGTMMVDSFATSYYKRSHFSKAQPVEEDDERGGAEAEHAGHVHVHTHGTHGHAHGSVATDSPVAASLSERVRHRVVSQVSIAS